MRNYMDERTAETATATTARLAIISIIPMLITTSGSQASLIKVDRTARMMMTFIVSSIKVSVLFSMSASFDPLFTIPLYQEEIKRVLRLKIKIKRTE